jgi:hypothetical protein
MREISPHPGTWPGIWLAHVVSRRYRPSTYETKMRLTPVLLDRPAEGKARHNVKCGHCGQHVAWTVFSAAATRRARDNRLVIAFAGVLVLGATIALIAITGLGGELNPPAQYVLLSVLGIFGGLVVLVTGLVMWFGENGIRVADGNSRFYPVHVSRRATPRQISSLPGPR